MGGILLLMGFLLCGLVSMDALLRRMSGLIRVWLGLCFGLIMMMWLPALCAFFMDFTARAQLFGLGAAGIIASGLCVFRYFHPEKRERFMGGLPLWLLLALVVPLALLSGYLQYTHILREVDGALHVGQSTYGDLCLHLGIATGLRNNAFPPDYTILKGALLGYPFLSDSLVTSMLLFGSGLAESFILTGTLMMALVYTGFVVFAWELTKRPMAVVLSFLFMFINGGLGFIYVMGDPAAFREIFTGFYKTPTNMPDLNLRWVNVICDMMVPQRTLLGGWTLLLPALFLLVRAMRKKRLGLFLLLGIWAGAMPMVHTHSFLGLGMISAGAMVYQLITSPKKRGRTLLYFLCYGAIAVALALPQLVTWTFPQTINGGSLTFRFNWVNNDGSGKLIENYFWFWIKNVGLIYLLFIPAFFASKKGSMLRTLSIGALLIYGVAELLQFQPNPYDNNKLFYVAFMAVLPSVGLLIAQIWDRMKNLSLRPLILACFMLVSMLSGSLSIARECVSDYQLFSASEVAAAKFIEENAPEKAIFLTGQQHNNAVAALTGRYIICGTGSYLYYHGIDYSAQLRDLRLMLEQPLENAALFDQYEVDYAYLSSYEYGNFYVDSQYFETFGTLVFDSFDVRIYALSDRAKALASQ